MAMPSTRPVESATMKRDLWVPPDEFGEDPDTWDWAVDDTLAPREDDSSPAGVPRPGRRVLWLVAGGMCLGAPVVLLAILAGAVATGGAVAWVWLADAPGPRITTLP
jgi:hypothetical protein